MLKISHFSPTKFGLQIKEKQLIDRHFLFILIPKTTVNWFPRQNPRQELVVAKIT